MFSAILLDSKSCMRRLLIVCKPDLNCVFSCGVVGTGIMLGSVFTHP